MAEANTSSPAPHDSWLRAIEKAAKTRDVSFPRFTGHAMGAARTESTASGRLVTFKQRLVSAAQAEIDGVEWAFWDQRNSEPEPVASFRAPLAPSRDDVAHVFSLLKGWLVDGLTLDAMKEAVEAHANPHCRS